MNRRNFIKVTGIGTGSILLASSLSSCSNKNITEAYGWNGPKTNENDIRLKVISYAILCPNPHNKQPWLINMTSSNSFELFVDPDRLLPETDPFYRQIHIGQGAFLESLSIAASGLKHELQIKYFPKGIYSNKELVNKPIASITLISNPKTLKDPLFDHLLNRQSNKREYDNISLTTSQKQSLITFHEKDSVNQLTFIESSSDKKKMVQILTQAMQIEVSNKKRDMETIKMFRFNDDEVQQYRDGFGLAQTGVSGLKKFVTETFFLSRDSVEEDSTSFGEQAVEMAKKTSETTATFGLLISKSNSRIDQIKIGRDYCRMNLKTTAMNIAQHPMSQILQEYEEMLPLQMLFKSEFNIAAEDTVQMLFRLGKAKEVEHSPRRLVSDIIMG